MECIVSSDFFSRALGILAIVVVFGGLIFFHELGHFLVARLFSMGVKTFSLGFGPPVISRQKGKTKYQVAALPLGGFVSLVGEQDPEDIPPPFTREDSFALRPAWQRFFVIAAGSVFNLILAWLLCWIIIAAYGKPELLPVLGTVMENSPAERSGLVSGDRVLSINGQPVDAWMSLYSHIQENRDQPMTLLVENKDGQRTLSVTPERMTVQELTGGENTIWGIGISPSGDSRSIEVSVPQAALEGVIKARDMVVMTWKGFAGLITRKISLDNVGGPILIGKTIYDQATTRSLADVLFLAAFISVNLGVLNLLPIPVLDGGHLLFIIIEMIVRRPVPRKVQNASMLIGMALLLLLMVFATYNDISRLVTNNM